MEENKNKISEEITSTGTTNSEENQTLEFFGEKKPNSPSKVIIIISLILIIVVIILILMLKPLKKENNKQDNINTQITPPDEIFIPTNSDDEQGGNKNQDDSITKKIEIYLEPTKYEVTGKKYIANLEEFIEEKNLNVYPKYIKNGEETPLESGDLLSIKNGELTYDAWGEIYSFTNYNNIESAAGYFSAQDGATIYFITKENKAYMTSQADNFETLYEFELENVEKIILTEYSFESCEIDGAIIKTKDNKYYFHKLYNNERYFKELIIDETKIENVTQEQKIINNIEEIKLAEEQEIDEMDEIYDITSNEYHISSNAEKGLATTEISLNNGNLKIYTPTKVFVHKNNIIKYITIDYEIETITDFHIFYVTKENELYRIHIKNDKLESFVKYYISNVELISKNYEDKENKTILVKTKDNEYMLDYKEDIIYKIKY